MKTVLYYFSGTGNSLASARHLSVELGDTEIIPIAKAIEKSADIAADRVGIVFPVYIFGLPLIVAEFVKKLRVEQSKYIFGVATNGGMLCATLLQLEAILKNRGLKLSAGFGIQQPDNYIPIHGAIDAEKQQKMFEKEKTKIKYIAGIVKEGRECKIEKSAFLQNLIFSGLIYKKAAQKIPASDKNFYHDDKCGGCGLCEKVCPVKNIKLENGRPIWQHKCEQCLACLQWCPSESIQFGKKTAGRKRYHHPEVQVNDFMF